VNAARKCEGLSVTEDCREKASSGSPAEGDGNVGIQEVGAQARLQIASPVLRAGSSRTKRVTRARDAEFESRPFGPDVDARQELTAALAVP
jgi:hypothetical protein